MALRIIMIRLIHRKTMSLKLKVQSTCTCTFFFQHKKSVLPSTFSYTDIVVNNSWIYFYFPLCLWYMYSSLILECNTPKGCWFCRRRWFRTSQRTCSRVWDSWLTPSLWGHRTSAVSTSWWSPLTGVYQSGHLSITATSKYIWCLLSSLFIQ